MLSALFFASLFVVDVVSFFFLRKEAMELLVENQ